MDVEIWGPMDASTPPEEIVKRKFDQAEKGLKAGNQPEINQSARENLKSLIYSELLTSRACAETVSYALHKIMNAVDVYAYNLSKDSVTPDMPTDEEIEDMRWKV